MSGSDPTVQVARHESPPAKFAELQCLIAPYERASNLRALWQLATSLPTYVLTWYLMYRSLAGPYWVTLALALLAAGFLIRLFIVQHDCGHGSFFTTARANRIVGRMCSVITLTPYRYWQRFHAVHHATSSKLDRRESFDVVTMTVREYLASSPWGRLRYRLYRHPLTLFGVLPLVYFSLFLRWPGVAPRGWARERRSILLTDAAIVAYFGVIVGLVGPGALALVQIPITLIAATAGMWLFYVQHQFEDTYWDGDVDWDYTSAALEGSSFYALPSVLAWFTGYIGLHHVHHLSTKVPSYRLLACVEENAAFRDVPRLELAESFRCARLALWDERSRRLVSFSEAHGNAVFSASGNSDKAVPRKRAPNPEVDEASAG